MPKSLAALVSLALLAGCSLGSHRSSSPAETTSPAGTASRLAPPTPPAPERPRGPVRLGPTPVWVRDGCGAFAVSLRLFCPRAIPVGGDGKLTMTIVVASRRNPVNVLDLEAGSESLGDQRKNRPPNLVGVLLVGGDLEQALSGLLPRAESPPVRVRAGLANVARSKPISLGRRRWAGLEGELSLAPSRGRYPLAYFRYLFFRWHDVHGAHAVGLRDWEPFPESVRTLHALIDDLAPARAKRFAYRAHAGPVAGVEMARTPAWLLAACRALRTRPICPRQIPAASPSYVNVFFEPNIVGPGGRQDWLSVEWGTPHGDTANNRPPGFVHLDLRAGAIRLNKRFQRPPVAPRDGVFLTRSAGPLPLGHPRWAGRSGILVLGDCFGNHLCFRWPEQAVGYQIDLHGWEPFSETVAALQATVGSLSSPRR